MVEVVGDVDDLVPLRAEWEDLAANALEPSPSCEWWMLIPALRHELPGNDVRVALVYAVEEATSGKGSNTRTLCGVFPFETLRRYRRLPARVLRLWNHIYTMTATPLVRRKGASECVRAFFAWVRTAEPARTLVQFSEIHIEGEFFPVLSGTLEEQGLDHLHESIWARAMFRAKADAEQYLQSIGTAHHRQEWRRYARRLGERGTLEFDELQSSAALEPWLEEFVALEMSGWKGEQGGAFGCNERHLAWLREVMTEAHRQQRLMILALRLDGKSIAMRINVMAAPGAYTFKIAFDEAFFKFSPGVLVELENIRRLHTRRTIEWMDSVAVPNHPLLNRVWAERTALVTLVVAPGRATGRLLLAAVPLLRTFRRILEVRRS